MYTALRIAHSNLFLFSSLLKHRPSQLLQQHGCFQAMREMNNPVSLQARLSNNSLNHVLHLRALAV